MPSRLPCSPRPLVSALAVALAVGALTAPAVRAQSTPGYSFTTLVVPGAVNAYALGINAAGQIVGFYQDASTTSHGFLDNAGTFTTLDVPGPTYFTAPSGINAAGQIVGTYSANATGVQGFVYRNGSYTTLPQVQGRYSPAVARASGLNDAGQIVGSYYDPPGAGNAMHGFLYDGTAAREIDVPATVGQFSYLGNTSASGINNAGQVVGSYSLNGQPSHGFLDVGGAFTTIDAPGAVSTSVFGIGAAGQIVGSFQDAAGAHGFVDIGGIFTVLNVPGATLTSASGINAAGQIVGYYQDAAGYHGFVATPATTAAPEPATLALVVAGLGGFGAAARRRRRA